MSTRARDYIPALNREWLTPLYDPLLRYGMREEVFKNRIIQRAAPRAGQQILDIGCGTGTFTMMIQQAQPETIVTGLDGDETVLEIAQIKAARAGISDIVWQKGFSFNLPFPDASYDVVVASMMLHHLTRPNKLATFKEVRRVLKPGSNFWVVDFGPAHDMIMKIVTLWMSRLEQTSDLFRGLLPGLLQEAGFRSVTETDRFRCFFGPLSIYRVQE